MTRIAVRVALAQAPPAAQAIGALLRPEEIPGSRIAFREPAAGVVIGELVREDSSAACLQEGPRGLWIAFDGRLDNREELVALADGGETVSNDAGIVLALWRRRGEKGLRRIEGDFAFAIVDPTARSIRLGRDTLGNRTVFYRRTDSVLAIASRAEGLLGVDVGGVAVRPVSIARFLALRGPASGETFFEEIREVAPGTLVELDDRGARVRTFDELRPATLPGRSEEGELAEELLALVTRAVRLRMAGASRVAVQMSGGLDSTTVAALAARERPEREVVTISYVFDELSAVDESPWIDAMTNDGRFDDVRFAGDGEWPFRDGWLGPPASASPMRPIYGRLRERVLALASERGCDVLLTGEFSDELWTGGALWFPHLLGSGRWGAAVAGAARSIAWSARGIRPAYPVLSSLAAGLRGRRHAERPSPVPEWMNERGAAEIGVVPAPSGALDTLVSPLALAHLDRARDDAERRGIEIRFPFRDRRLAEWAAALPPALTYQPGRRKYLFRKAIESLLPVTVRARRSFTPMTPLADRGLGDRESRRIGAMIEDPGAWWPRWVRRESLQDAMANAFVAPPTESGRRALVWQCLTLEAWRRGLPTEVARAPFHQ